MCTGYVNVSPRANDATLVVQVFKMVMHEAGAAHLAPRFDFLNRGRVSLMRDFVTHDELINSLSGVHLFPFQYNTCRK